MYTILIYYREKNLDCRPKDIEGAVLDRYSNDCISRNAYFNKPSNFSTEIPDIILSNFNMKSNKIKKVDIPSKTTIIGLND